MRATIYGMVTAAAAALALMLFECLQGDRTGLVGVDVALPLAALSVWAMAVLLAIVVVLRIHHRTRRRVRYVSRRSRAMRSWRSSSDTALVIRAER